MVMPIPYLLIRSAGLLSLALFAALLAPATASASCGDYLADNSFTVFEPSDPPTNATSPSKPAPAAPCQGPQCRQAPERMPVPPPATPHVNDDRTVDSSAAHSAGDRAKSGFAVPSSDLFEPRDAIFSLMRPPRP
jgi:hypothetical protein